MTVEVENTEQFIPGMRVQVRDAEWRIDRVDVPTDGGMLLTCAGHSELVRERTAKFLTRLEYDVKALSPEMTHLVDDIYRAEEIGGQGRNRTTDTRIFSIWVKVSELFSLLPTSSFSRSFSAILSMPKFPE